MKLAYFDCFSGISGDMTLGALVDLGVPVETIESGVRSLGLGDIRVTAEIVKKAGFRAVKVHIEHPPEHAHRHLHHIEEMIDRADSVDPAAKVLAKQIFALIGQAEAKMHNTTIRKVHFHEVGAIDSIADIVGTAIGFHFLGIERVECSAVPTGCGSVQIAHGLVSIPAPATAELLRGFPIVSTSIERELTTPTGAAILKATAKQFGPLPSMRLSAVGYGAGTIDLPGQANVLRIVLGETDAEAAHGIPLDHDRVIVLETNIDDSTAQELADCAARLIAAGALDVFQTACVMKKGRSGVLLTVICSASRVACMQQLMFAHTSTIGIRHYAADRVKLVRQGITLETSLGPVSAKVVQLGDGKKRMTVENDDACEIATKRGVTLADVRHAANNAWTTKPDQK